MNTPTPPPVDFAALNWVKATASSNQGACVELAAAPQGWVALRDSKNKDREPLLFTPAELTAFLDGAKGGEFDHLT
ncbi:DUF397 domain-containing protein [Streptomyces sp. WZ-12]|uniref:DUF397 domain-containing protein n=1 Tax=Streptomyces sp. WZ-12 TaxID=3030210 RepID=UPI0023814613|nr:DUF397 domain-containing protein [Streptomyces sp. WZ-12]